jgi:hypothetical protein
MFLCIFVYLVMNSNKIQDYILLFITDALYWRKRYILLMDGVIFFTEHGETPIRLSFRHWADWSCQRVCLTHREQTNEVFSTASFLTRLYSQSVNTTFILHEMLKVHYRLHKSLHNISIVRPLNPVLSCRSAFPSSAKPYLHLFFLLKGCNLTSSLPMRATCPLIVILTIYCAKIYRNTCCAFKRNW